MNKTFYSMKRLFTFIRPYFSGFFISILTVFITCITLAITPTVEGSITTQLMNDAQAIFNQVEGAHVNMEFVASTILVLIGFYLIKTVSQLVGNFTLTNSIQNAMHDLRKAVIEKIHNLPIKTLDHHPFGDILSRITNDIDTVSNALQQTFINIVNGILVITLALFMMLRINLDMTLIIIAVLPISFFVTKKVAKISQKKFTAQQEALGDLNANITEIYAGYNEIILYGKQDDAIEKFVGIAHNLKNMAFSAQFISYLMSPLLSLVTYLSIGIVSIIGCFNVLNGVINVGQLQAFVRYIWQVNDPISQVSQLSAQIQAAIAAMNRIVELLDMEEEVDTVSQHVTTMDGHVEFEHVAFGYDDSQLIIKDLNLDVKPEQRYAIVGPTGAGKTTIVNLLMRFYDVNAGTIKVDGIPIKNLSKNDYRQYFGMVLQDTWLFSGTIMDNLRFGNLNATDEEVIEAAKLANAHEFIESLPQGYQTVIDEESTNISQGEKQLLTIARALLKDPKILILDEATSSIDTKTEKLIQDAMDTLMEKRTSFIIAHRLSTIQNADCILVLNHGEVIEKGTHHELLKANGFYAKLYNAQFQTD